MNIKCAHSSIEKISDLKPHPYNENKHPERQINALAKIIAKNGQRSPIVVSKLSGMIVKGHGRYEAIKMLGWESCAVDFQEYNSELDELNDRVADNEIAKYSEFAEGEFLSNLQNMNVDLSEVDFSEFGMLDFNIPTIDSSLDDCTTSIEETEKYILQVELPNEMELRDLYDDLISKGYLVKEL